MIYTFLVDGFEEIEAIAPVDIIKRAGFEVTIVSLGDRRVKCARGTVVECDKSICDVDFSDASMVLLPGGPGAAALDDERIKTVVTDVIDNKKGYIGAICAAPHILGKWGLLNGKRATCFPGFEKYLEGAEFTAEYVTVDEPFITAAGAGAALEYGYKIVELLKGKEAADGLRESMRGPRTNAL